MKSNIGEAIAFLALVAGATTLEIFDKPAAGLWVLVVIWALFSTFKMTKKED